MSTWRLVGTALAGGLGLAAGFWLAAARWRRRTVARLRAGSSIAATPQGPLEYGTAGVGPPVLVLHGGPGGYDQGLTLADLFGGAPRVVAPSRPGYLRSPLETGRTPAEQADAAVALLDRLDIQQVAVVGVSGSGPSAIQIGLRHPRRVSRLVLWQVAIRRTQMDPATYARLTGGFMTTDLGAWLLLSAIRLAPRLALPAGTRADPGRRARMQALLTTFFPLDLRRDGLRNDVQQNAELPDYPLHDLGVPTLIVHGSADTTVPYEQAESAARSIPNARLVTVEGGTHESTFVVSEALDAIAAFLDEGAEESSPESPLRSLGRAAEPASPSQPA